LNPIPAQAAESTAPTAADVPDYSGSWQIAADSPSFHAHPLCVFQQAGDRITGHCMGGSNTGPVEGIVKGDSFNFVWQGTAYISGGECLCTFTGKRISATQFSGTVEAMGITTPFVAIRQENVIATEQPPENSTNISGCAPKPGEGALWLSSCENAAKAGDGNAAIIAGKIYWNGDGVPKDNTSAAHWWNMADQVGNSEAAKLLGDEAYVRTVQSEGPGKLNLIALDEGISWYRKAVGVELIPTLRQEARSRLDQFLKLKSFFPSGCPSGVGGPKGCEPR
jgi:hypothetical protein